MNRSLEALAIFTICLAGILAVVRSSTQERSDVSAVANPAMKPSVPTQESGSATESAHSQRSDALAATIRHSQGCGLDRATGVVHAPQGPLLSQREIAQQAIRSAPWKMYVLPDADEAAHDEAMQQAAAAELVAADEGLRYEDLQDQVMEEFNHLKFAYADPFWRGIENRWAQANGIGNESLTSESESLVQRCEELWMQASEQLGSLKYTYADPFWRAIETRWSHAKLSTGVQSPKLPKQTEARRPLLLRQRAESGSAGKIHWDDYLAFAERELSIPRTSRVGSLPTRKEPKSRLFPRF